MLCREGGRKKRREKHTTKKIQAARRNEHATATLSATTTTTSCPIAPGWGSAYSVSAAQLEQVERIHHESPGRHDARGGAAVISTRFLISTRTLTSSQISEASSRKSREQSPTGQSTSADAVARSLRWMDGWTVGCTVPAFRRLADWLAGWLAGWLAARPITNGDWNCIPQRWLQRTTLQTFPFNLSALRALLKSLPRRTSGFTSSLGGLSVKSTYSLPKDRTSPPRWHGCREWGGGRSGKGESRQNSSPWITFSGLRLEMAGRHRSHVREHGAVALRLLGSSDFSSAR